MFKHTSWNPSISDVFEKCILLATVLGQVSSKPGADLEFIFNIIDKQ